MQTSSSLFPFSGLSTRFQSLIFASAFCLGQLSPLKGAPALPTIKLPIPGQAFVVTTEHGLLNLDKSTWPTDGPFSQLPYKSTDIKIFNKDDGESYRKKLLGSEWFHIDSDIFRSETGKPIQQLQMMGLDGGIFSDGRQLLMKKGTLLLAEGHEGKGFKGKPLTLQVKKLYVNFKLIPGDEWIKVEKLPESFDAILHLANGKAKEISVVRKKDLYSFGGPVTEFDSVTHLSLAANESFASVDGKIRFQDLKTAKQDDKPYPLKVVLPRFKISFELIGDRAEKISDLVLIQADGSERKDKVIRDGNRYRAQFVQLDWKNQPFELKGIYGTSGTNPLTISYKENFKSLKNNELTEQLKFFDFWEKIYITLKGRKEKTDYTIKFIGSKAIIPQRDPQQILYDPKNIDDPTFKDVLDPRNSAISIYTLSKNPTKVWPTAQDRGKKWLECSGITYDKIASNEFEITITLSK
jgi:hypothetical protein